MGNSSSNSSADTSNQLKQEIIESQEATPGTDAFDFSILIDSQTLQEYNTLDKSTKHDQYQKIFNHKTAITNWLNEKNKSGDEWISKEELIDKFTQQGVLSETVEKFWDEIDEYSNNKIHLPWLLNIIDEGMPKSNLPDYIKRLKDCVMLPSLSDVFLSNDSLIKVQKDHSKMLNCFIKNCSPNIKLITPDSIKFFFNTAKSRHIVLCNHFEKICAKMLLPQKKDEQLLDSIQLVDKPYTSIVVSSNQCETSNLTDGLTSTSWTSSGSSGTHYIRFHMKPNILVDQLSMTYGSESSYTPKCIDIMGGMSEDKLQLLTKKTLASVISHGTEIILSRCSNYHRYIQINIKDCFQGGCDTRIRGVKMTGYSLATVKNIAESEAIYTWLLTLVTCTATSSIQSHPLLRASILQQTQKYFQYIPPLSLTYTSPGRASFMGKEFISQLQIFLLTTIHTHEQKHGIDVDAFKSLIKFCISHGYLHLTLPVFTQYIEAVIDSKDSQSLTLSCVQELRQLETTVSDIINAHPPAIIFNIESSEGFSKPNEDLAKIITYGNIDLNEAICYASKEGERVLNLLLLEKKNRDFCIQKIKILVKNEKDKKPNVCMVFCIPQSEIDPKTSKPFDCTKLLDLYRQYDFWTIEDWKNYQDKKSDSAGMDTIGPVCFFDLETNTCEFGVIDVWPDICYCCLIKILGPKLSEDDESSKKSVIHTYGIQCFGDVNTSSVRNILSSKLNANYLLTTNVDENVNCMVFILRFLASHVLLMRNQASIIERLDNNTKHGHHIYSSKLLFQSHLFMDDLTFKQVWDTYLILEKLFLCNEEHRTIGMEISLLFLLACIPFLISIDEKNKLKEEETKELKLQALSHLLDLLNNEKLEPSLLSLIDKIITQGVTLIMPDEEARKEKLLSGAKLACSTEKYPRATISVAVALIQYYSTNEMNKLLNLPNIATLDQEKEIEFDIEFLMDTITPLLNVFYRKTELKVNQFVSPDSFYSETDIQILPLLTAVQKSIFNWCYTLAFNQNKSEHTLKFAKLLLCRYLGLLEREVNDILKLLNQYIHIPRILDAFQASLLANIFPQAITLLSSFYTLVPIRDYVIHTFQGFVHKFTEVINSLPNFELEYCSLPDNSNCIINEWQRESAHSSYSHKDEKETFSCHGADFFIIDFHRSCKLENGGYEYLDFTDQEGKKQRFAGSYGQTSWPTKFTFNTEYLAMRFVTEGGEYGYKFTLKAYGSMKNFHWFRNLNFSLSYLFGKFCSENLKHSDKSKALTDEELVMLQSNIGKHIFRGGLQKARFIRSYSGMHHTNTESDSKVEEFIKDIISDNQNNQKAIDFIQSCQASFRQPRFGGKIADKAINATFAALLWHSQELRDEVARYEAKKEPGKISSRIANVYKLAESIRSSILVNKHTLIKQKEDFPESDIDPDLPVNDCIEKALFLLKFSGLSRSEIDIDKGSQKRTKLSRKKLKHAGSVSQVEKEPHVEMILNFVNKDSYSIKRIRDDMEERTRLAQNRIVTYSFCRDFLLFASKNTSNSEAKNNLAIFLTSLLGDYSITPIHYGGNLDGCGLEIERKVRDSFYSLIEKLFTWIWNENTSQTLIKLSPIDKFLLTILHYFFNNIWKDFDYKFVKEYFLPKRLYVTAYSILAKSSNSKKDEKCKPAELLQEYIGSISILVFYSLAMQVSSRIQEIDVPIDDTYLNYAIQVYSDCLRALAQSIRAGLNALKKKDSEKKAKKDSSVVESKSENELLDKRGNNNLSFTIVSILTTESENINKEDATALNQLESENINKEGATTQSQLESENINKEGITAQNQLESENINKEGATAQSQLESENINKEGATALNQLETENKQSGTESSSEIVSLELKTVEESHLTTAEAQNAIPEANQNDVILDSTNTLDSTSILDSTSCALNLIENSIDTSLPKDDTKTTQKGDYLEVNGDESKSTPIPESELIEKDESTPESELTEKDESTPESELTEKTESKPESELTEKAESTPESELTEKTESKPESELTEKTGSKPEFELTEKTESKPESELTEKTGSKPEFELTEKTESKPESEQTEKTGSKPEFELTEKTGSKPESDLTEKTESKPEFELTEKTESKPEFELTEKTESTPEFELSEKTESTPESELTEKTESTPESELTEKTESTPESELIEKTESTPEFELTEKAESKLTEKTESELTENTGTDNSNTKDVEVKSKIGDTEFKNNSDVIPNDSELEMLFGETYFTQNLCALGGLAPLDPNNARWSCSDVSVQCIINYEILPLLLDIIQYNSMKESQLLALTLIVRFISRSDPEYVDEMMSERYPELIPPSKQNSSLLEETTRETETDKLIDTPRKTLQSPTNDSLLPPAGVVYMRFLTNLGTNFLSKHKHLQMSSVGRCLYELLNEKAWMKAYMYNLEKHLQSLPYIVNVDCIFHILVLAGFPQLPAFGIQVEVEHNTKHLSALMVQTKESTTNYEVILKHARMVTNCLQKDVQINQPSIPLLENSTIVFLLNLTINCIKITDKSTEQSYVTFLLLKTINNFILKDTTEEVIRTVIQSGISELIAQFTYKATSIDKKWQIPELEHVCMICYQPEASRAETPTPINPEVPVDTNLNKMKEEDTNRQKIEDRDPLNNVSDEMKDLFINLSSAFACQLSVIRASYEHLKQNKVTLIENVQRWYQDDKGLQIPEEVKKKATNWEPLEDIPEPPVTEEIDETLDNGLLNYTSMIVNSQNFRFIEDEKETTKEKDILIPPKNKEKSEYEKMKIESKALLSDKTKETIKSKELKKLINALTILQSRHILFSLILNWKVEEPLCNAIFQTLEISRIFSILHYAQCSMPKEDLDQVIIQLGKHTSDTTKRALAVEASKILGPIKGTILHKESEHPNTKSICNNKILANNAVQFIITPDPLCEFGDADEILFGGDENFSDSRQEMNGKQFKAKKCLIINCKSLYYKIKTPNPTGWGWKIQVTVVTSGVLSYFDSTYNLLENILSNITDFSLLPLSVIWVNLFLACCSNLNEKRYKILYLMCHVLRLCVSYNESLKSNVGEVTNKPDPEITVDLKLLHPFCEYYAKLISQNKRTKKTLIELKVPTIARVLTEFFVQVEICAVKCGLEEDLWIARVLSKNMETLLSTAINNLALFSIGIDLDNKVASEFIKAKRNYKPKPVSDIISTLKELPFSTFLIDEDSNKSRSASISSSKSNSSELDETQSEGSPSTDYSY